MNAAIAFGRWLALWLVRLELVLLSVFYTYLVLSDNVPFWAFGLIALIWLARGWTTGALTRTTTLDLPILVLLVWLPISFSVSINPWLSLPKVYGVILGAAFYYAVVNHVTTRRDIAAATFWLVLVCAGIALAGLVGTDWAQGRIISASFIYDRLPRFIQGIPRSIAGGFARNGVGGTLTLVIPLLAGLALVPATALTQERFHRVWLPHLVAAALALSLIALALTQSRGGILGTAVGLLALAVWRDRRFVWLLVAVGLGLIGLIALGYGGFLVDSLLQMDARSGTLASRVEVWQRGIMMVQDFPFTGIGIGTYNPVAHLLYPFFIAAPDEVVAHAHNNLLQVAVDVGIPGLVAFVALLTGFVIGAVRAFRASADDGVRALVAGLACGMLAHQTFGLTDAFILGTKPGVLMWVFLALIAMIDGRRREWQIVET